MLPTKAEPWAIRTLRKPDRPLVEWARLGTLGNPECTIGILRSGTWVVDTADGLADLSDERALTFAFPLLNVSINAVRQSLESYLQENHLDRGLSSTFPFIPLVGHAVENGGYWAEQSFGWLQDITLSEAERGGFIDGLKRIEANKDFGQKLRHDAMKQRVRLERIG